MFFLGLISALLVLRAQAPYWPPPDQPRLPIIITGINSLVLIASAWTMLRALGTLGRGESGFPTWLGFTAFLGAFFLAIQGYEWVRLVQFGLTTSSSLYGGTFYTIVGAHALHVLVALVALIAVLVWALRGRYTANNTQSFQPMVIYWLFVVGLWPILYVLVYLL
jgi:heme/copper-type cytochrome/quinol oxidase subunit 3